MREKWGDSASTSLLDRDLDNTPGQRCDFVEHNQAGHSLGPFGKVEKYPITRRDPLTIESLEYRLNLPPEINAAQVSRQQFTANAATAFLFVQEKKILFTWRLTRTGMI